MDPFKDLIHLDIDFEKIRLPFTATLALFVYLLFFINVNYPERYDEIGNQIACIELAGDYQQSELLSVLMTGQ